MRLGAFCAALVLLALACGCAGSQQAPSGYLEIRLADDEQRPDYIEVNVAGMRAPIYVSPIVELTEADIEKAEYIEMRPAAVRRRGKSAMKKRHAVGVKFGWFASRKLGRLTDEHTGERLAIIVAGRVVSAPRITGRIEGGMLIHGNFNKADAKMLAAVLNQAPIGLK